MSMSFEIRSLTVNEIEPYLDCSDAVIRSNGQNGTPIFCAYDEETPWPREKKKIQFLENLPKKTSEPGWQRTWALFDSNGKVHGDISLWSANGKPSLHRAWLGMGIQNHLRGFGWGTKLMETAINWAKNEPILRFIDLNVMEENSRAIALYERFGFEKTGYWNDRWRLMGRSVGEFWMTLPLRNTE